MATILRKNLYVSFPPRAKSKLMKYFLQKVSELISLYFSSYFLEFSATCHKLFLRKIWP